MKQQKHTSPAWTFIVTPIALAIMILTPWAELNKQAPEAAPLMLICLSIGISLVGISIAHWVKQHKTGG